MRTTSQSKMGSKLFDAVSNNDINEVKMILENGTVPATVTETTKSNSYWTWTLAHRALENGNLDMLKYLVKKEPSLLLKKIDEEDNTKRLGLLEYACEKPRFNVVKYLVKECKVDIFEERLIENNYDDSFNATNPIYIAAKYGRLKILKYLIKEGNVDVNAPFRPRKDIKYPKSLLFIADESVFEYLLKETNIDVTVVDENGDNILFWFGIHPDEEILKYVLDKHRDKFDINRKNSEGRTFLHHYLDERTSSVNLEFIQYLVEREGANISIPDDNFKWTPLHFAAANNLPIVCKYLINMGASLESEDKDGDTPLHLAAIGGVVDVCKVLIKHGANKNPKNKKGDSPLHYVISGYYEKFDGKTSLSSSSGARSAPKVFAYLIDHGADITQKNNEEKTPLDYIFARGDLKGLKYLIRRRIIGVDHENEREETLVQLAVIYNQIPILDYLVRKKHANMNAQGFIRSKLGFRFYMSPLQTALHLRHYESSKYLMKQGAFLQQSDCTAEDREMFYKIEHELNLGRARRSLAPESLSTPFQNHSLNNFIDRGRSVSVKVQNQTILGTANPFVFRTTYNVSQFGGFVSLMYFWFSYIQGPVFRPEAITLQKKSEDMTIEEAINTLPNLGDIN